MLAIYGKHKEDKRFSPFDYTEGRFVINKMFMTMWDDEKKDYVRGLVDHMNVHNDEFIFEIREVK